MELLKPGRKLKGQHRTYEIVRQIGDGGSGIVFSARSGVSWYALKLFFPNYQLHLFQGQTAQFPIWLEEVAEFQRREHAFLSGLSHPNIVRVLDSGDINLTRSEQRGLPRRNISTLPFLVTDLVEGKPLSRAMEAGLSAPQLTFILLRIARALEYLHAERKYLHADIRAANVMIRAQDFEPILIDFALCKNLNFTEVSADEHTKLVGDWDLFPRELATDHQLKALKESSGTRADLERMAFPWLDLYQFGRMLRDLQFHIRRVYDARESAYLLALADELTNWDRVTKWSTRDLAPRIDRLGAEHYTTFGVPELVAPTAAERTITIPPAIGVPLTKYVERIIETRSFRRLHQVNQLSLLGLVYPAADYKRSVHVLFAYDLARQFVVHLYGVPRFRLLFDRKSVQQLLATVLLHDINHFPFLHIFQESKVEALRKIDVVDLFCSGDATGERAAQQPSIYELLSEVELEPARFKRLVFSPHHLQDGSDIAVDQTISSLINSGVDLDKLSYLFLDSYFTGVKYGAGIDLPALLKAAVVGVRDVGGKSTLHLAFDDRALQAVENVVMTRFWNFRAIYWHHTNRAVMAMILHVVRSLYEINGHDVKGYLLDTMWRTDTESVRYLDEKYQHVTGRPSVLNGLVEDRSRLYKRIYTVRAGVGDDIDDVIHDSLRKLDVRAEVRFRRALAIGIGEILRRGNSGTTIREDDVLVDVPRREMDSGGSIFLQTSERNVVPLSSVSEPVRAISANYDRLTKRARIFLRPGLAVNLDSDWRAAMRPELQRVMQTAIEVSDLKSQVQ